MIPEWMQWFFYFQILTYDFEICDVSYFSDVGFWQIFSFFFCLTKTLFFLRKYFYVF